MALRSLCLSVTSVVFQFDLFGPVYSDVFRSQCSYCSIAVHFVGFPCLLADFANSLAPILNCRFAGFCLLAGLIALAPQLCFSLVSDSVFMGPFFLLRLLAGSLDFFLVCLLACLRAGQLVFRQR